MIPEKALALAGPGAVLVHRPRGRVPHVYVGPLTPSGRYVPRSGRTVCRAHTLRLSVLAREGSSLEHSHAGPGRVCARCSVCLQQRGQAEPHLTTRAAYLAEYFGTTMADVAFALELAQTPAEVDAAAHLSLLLFDVAGCNTPFVDERGRQWRSLHDLVYQARGRVDGFPESYRLEAQRHAELSEAARDQRRRESKAAYEEREKRIEAARPPRPG